ncbi:MAG: DUF4301 family protein [Odoribacter sp.]
MKNSNYSKEDLKHFKQRDIKAEQIDRQWENLKKGMTFVALTEPATVGNGITRIEAEAEECLLTQYEKARQTCDLVKMIPASGSATRMFKDLFTFSDTYKGTEEEFLALVQQRGPSTMFNFFTRLSEMPFYDHLTAVMWKEGKDIQKMIAKREYLEVLPYILGKKGLNYGNTPKGLVDFHIYRDFVRTAFDEHLVEGALYCNNGKKAQLHFTVSEEYLSSFKNRLKKVSKVFEKMFQVKYDVTFSIQKPATDTVSLDATGELLRDEEGQIVFRPGGHGALIYNLDELKADLVFIKNIDNVIPDRAKDDTVKYKKLLAGTLMEVQEKVFSYLHLLDKKPTAEQLTEIDAFMKRIGYKEAEGKTYKDAKEHIHHLRQLLNRPIRVCGMVKNEGEPGGGPFWVKAKDGSARLMIVESAQINLQDKEQKKVVDHSTHFNPVDLVCGIKNYKGKRFDLENFIDAEQGFISQKSYKGKEIKVQELPGLWNGAMANWITVFIEEPLTTFTPVKTVFDLFRVEHRNVLKNE